MALQVSDEVLDRVQMTSEELLTDLACYLYDKERLSFGKCCALCGLNHLEFQRALAQRGIDMKYTERDLETDLRNLGIRL